jgi:hypothetical protein
LFGAWAVLHREPAAGAARLMAKRAKSERCLALIAWFGAWAVLHREPAAGAARLMAERAKSDRCLALIASANRPLARLG